MERRDAILVVVTISALIMEPTSNQQATSGLVNDIVPFVILGGEGEATNRNPKRDCYQGNAEQAESKGHEGGHC
ncbi:hypothetical protein F5Y00DRAFT_262143 [Daldinia vernicosa]|uniref:uncharacterized protein n=1 Tax=Daldinia vernicosa TaxID=114800 RepID=UPI0020074E91|nr:uncharacterized protein F5Y00DRAFT_262143 [Daldinia vernicosa]KAI0848986.1 hypothetical protein F5Y00DRAFT_262143 [Daldinia vernicosa]